MSMTDWAVIGICLAGGYWLVSLFLDRPASQAGPHPDDATANETPAPWWEVLHVSPTASMDEIRRAYGLRMSEYHPDKVSALGAELRDLAARKASEINAAYDEACRIHAP